MEQYQINEIKNIERSSFAILAAALLVTAWNSYGYFHPDEHWQIIEFAGTKLGIVQSQNLPWEYNAGIRPWLQPVFFVGLCKILSFCGVANPFIWSFVFRLCCSVCGFTAILSIYSLSLKWFSGFQVRRMNLRLCTTLGFLPYLLVRTSSENISTSFMTIGMVFILRNLRESKSDTFHLSNRICLFSGLMLGLAFQFRYQTILMTGGLGLWLLLSSKINWRNTLTAATGFLIALVVGLFADRYGYGKWTFPFYRYFKVNLIEGKTADFGTDPFFAYLYLVLENVFAPVVFVLMVLVVIFWVRKPRHVISWITIPFFIFHCFIGHKDERFLFPMIPLCLLIPSLLLFKDGKIVLPQFFQKQFWRQTYKWFWRYNWIWLVLICIYPFYVEPNIKQQKFIYENQNLFNTCYAVGFNPYRHNELIYSFYRPHNLNVIEVESMEELTFIAKENLTQSIYFFWKMPYLENWPDELAKKTTLVNSSYFFFNWPWLAKTCIPVLKKLNMRFEEIKCPSLFKLSPEL